MGWNAMKKILIVDDEKDIRKLLKECLEMEGYRVDTAANGMEAITRLAGNPDLILLDINMPDMDGYQVCEKIRDHITSPILFLTARTEEQDRVNGFKSGGDDYVLKPFGVDELLARVEAHLRREERRSNGHYRQGDLLVDITGHRVLLQDNDINLTKTEFNIVELLVTHKGQVFDKEQIYERVRGLEASGDSNIITEHIRRIRRKLEQYGGQEYIVTVWGTGYRWNT